MCLSKSILTLLAISSIALSTRADDRYVDAVNGNDANDGLTTGSAWKSLTHALAAIPATPLAPHMIHVAPGVYNPANGERYPLVMRPQIRIVGDHGSATTFLESAGSVLLLFDSDLHTTGYNFQSDSGADGLTLQNSMDGIDLTTDWSGVSPSFHDLVISGMSLDGIYVLAGSNGGGPFAHPTFDHTTIMSCQEGVSMEGFGACSSCFGSAQIDLTDCVVRANASRGIDLSAAHGGAEATLVRTRIQDNGGDGIGGSCSDGGANVTARACLIAGNFGSGVHLTEQGMSHSEFDLTDCTIAANTGSGLQVMVTGTYSEIATLKNCILYGNGDDIAGNGGIIASYSDSGDGALIGSPNCIAANPLFANPAIGDFRLRFGSPCIETGDPASSGALDLLSHARPLDGNLDTIAAVDMGAFEFEPLHRIGTPALGQQFGFEFWGATGSMSTLLLSKQPLTPAQSTPFGDLFLAPGTVIALGVVPARPGPPFVLRRTMPSNPALIGTTFSFQALTDSAAAPQGQAYTNATSFVVLP